MSNITPSKVYDIPGDGTVEVRNDGSVWHRAAAGRIAIRLREVPNRVKISDPPTRVRILN